LDIILFILSTFVYQFKWISIRLRSIRFRHGAYRCCRSGLHPTGGASLSVEVLNSFSSFSLPCLTKAARHFWLVYLHVSTLCQRSQDETFLSCKFSLDRAFAPPRSTSSLCDPLLPSELDGIWYIPGNSCTSDPRACECTSSNYNLLVAGEVQSRSSSSGLRTLHSSHLSRHSVR